MRGAANVTAENEAAPITVNDPLHDIRALFCRFAKG
jgi:hypothetical protein